MPSYKVIDPQDEGNGEPQEYEVHDFVAPNLDKDNKPKSHRQYKAEFKQSLTVKDSQFRLSDLVANRLSVEDEDRIRFESAVKEAVEMRMKSIHDDIVQKAHEEGLKKGREDGVNLERERLTKVIQTFESCIQSLVQLTPKVYAAHEALIMDFVSQFASIVARCEMKTNKNYLSSVLKEIVDRCGAIENIKIKLNAQDYKNYEKIKQELQLQFGTMRGLTFEQDDAIDQGGCRVETDYGEMRTHLEQQIESVRKEIEEKIPKAENV